MLTTVEHDQMLRFRDALKAALCAAAQERHRWPEVITTRYGYEAAWEAKERQLLMVMVNDKRAQLDAEQPVTEDEMHAVEQSAAGHVDYADKFTLRLAFLAYGLEWRP